MKHLRSYFLKLSNFEPAWIWIFLLYLFLIIGISRLNLMIMLPVKQELENGWHQGFVEGTGPAPLQYRFLSFMIPHAFIELFNADIFSVYIGFFFVCYLLSALVFHIYLRKWFSTKESIIGTLILIASLSFTFMAVLQPSSPLNLLIFILGFLFIRENRFIPLIIIIFIGSFNRFTPIFLIFVYVFVYFNRIQIERLTINSILLFISWVIPFIFLRLIYGIRDSFAPIFMFSRNIYGFLKIFLYPSIFNERLLIFYLFGTFWILGFVNYSKKPKFFKRGLLIVPIFILIHLIFASLAEVRLLLDLAPLIIPSGLITLFKYFK